MILRGPRGVLLSESFFILALSPARLRLVRHHWLRAAAIMLRHTDMFVMFSYYHLIETEILENLMIPAIPHPFFRDC
jgi:hypothetical protein